jgi:hypothetical protein
MARVGLKAEVEDVLVAAVQLDNMRLRRPSKDGGPILGIATMSSAAPLKISAGPREACRS